MRSPKREKKNSPAPFIPQLAKGQIIPDKKRRKRRPKGYQWGIKMRNKHTPAKQKRTNRSPLSPKQISESGMKEDVPFKSKLKSKRFNRDRIRDKESFSTPQKLCNNLEKPKPTSPAETRPPLFDALSDTKRVLVASVTVNPSKPFSKTTSPTLPPRNSNVEEPVLPSEKLSLFSSDNEPKRRRRSAIAGENFVASCLLFSSNYRKQLTNEKKKTRRISSVNDAQTIPRMKKLNKSFSASLSESKLNIASKSDQSDQSLGKSDAQVAFAQPWFSSLTIGSSKHSNLSSTPFKMANHNHPTFKAMSAAHTHKKTKILISPKMNRASMTTYRDMTQYDDDIDEENDVTSTSSSESESSSCSSAESSYELSSDDVIETVPSSGSVLDKSQWRDHVKNKRYVKRRKQERSPNFKKQLQKTKSDDETAKQVVLSQAFQEKNLKNSTKTTSEPTDVKLNDGIVIKRKRGRPRKYPLKPDARKNGPISPHTIPIETEVKKVEKDQSPSEEAKIIAQMDIQATQQQPVVSSPSHPLSPVFQATEEASPGITSPIYPSSDSPVPVRPSLSDFEEESEEIAKAFENTKKKENDMQIENEFATPLSPGSPKSPNLSEGSSDLDDIDSSLDGKNPSSKVQPTFLSRRDPTLPNWQSETSSLQSSPRAQAENEYDSRLSSTIYSGVLDDSFSTIFPTVQPKSPLDDSVQNEKGREKDPSANPVVEDGASERKSLESPVSIFKLLKTFTNPQIVPVLIDN